MFIRTASRSFSITRTSSIRPSSASWPPSAAAKRTVAGAPSMVAIRRRRGIVDSRLSASTNERYDGEIRTSAANRFWLKPADRRRDLITEPRVIVIILVLLLRLKWHRSLAVRGLEHPKQQFSSTSQNPTE